MLKNKKVLIGLKMFFGWLGIIAVLTEIIVLGARGIFVPSNFFSFFTIESNIFAAAVFLASASALRHNRHTDVLAFLRGAATLYMMTTGLVFAVFLSGLDPTVLTAVPWDNIVLHYIIPVAVVIDWVLDPPRRPVAFIRASLWLIYPIVYVAYTLIRGNIVSWYPYPFLNPDGDGYARVLQVSLGIAVTVLVLTWIVTRVKARTLHKGEETS